MTKQRPVPSGEIPENFTLTNQQKQQKPPPIQYLLGLGIYLTSGILPSGQENYFDIQQLPENNSTYSINYFYPSPSNINGDFSGTGLLATYPRDSGRTIPESGISKFNYNELTGLFSNAVNVSANNITSFRLNTENDLWNEAEASGVSQALVSGVMSESGSGNIDVSGVVGYIHYYPTNQELSVDASKFDRPVIIPFLSTYKTTESLFDPYPYKELQ